MTLSVGCPMWAHRPWFGGQLPLASAGRMLRTYASALTAVEGNTTFYALPSPETVDSWAADVPDDFRFCFKLPREITHDRRLSDVDRLLAEFVQRMAPLHDVMGPTSIQLPPSFGPNELTTLATFLDGLPSSLEWAVEVRHRDFFVGGSHERELDELLRSHDVNRVIFDTRALFDGPANTAQEIEAFERKPRLPVRPTATSKSPVVRFIGQTDIEANKPYLEPWIAKLRSWLDDGLTPYFFSHTPDNDLSPTQGRWVYQQVTGQDLGGFAPIESQLFD